MRVCAVVVGAAVLALAGGSQAGDRHQSERPPAIELKAVGEAREVPVNREASGCRIEVTAGIVTINTIVVRAGGQKTPITVARRLTAGEAIDLPLGPKQMVDGLRISHGGGGDYKIFICADPPPGAKHPEPPSGNKR
jgi:hypothetical protein